MISTLFSRCEFRFRMVIIIILHILQSAHPRWDIPLPLHISILLPIQIRLFILPRPQSIRIRIRYIFLMIIYLDLLSIKKKNSDSHLGSASCFSCNLFFQFDFCLFFSHFSRISINLNTSFSLSLQIITIVTMRPAGNDPELEMELIPRQTSVSIDSTSSSNLSRSPSSKPLMNFSASKIHRSVHAQCFDHGSSILPDSSSMVWFIPLIFLCATAYMYLLSTNAPPLTEENERYIPLGRMVSRWDLSRSFHAIELHCNFQGILRP